MFTVENLSVSYKKKRVVQEVNFQVESGSWTALVGPNGAGKSSVLKALVGLVGFDGSCVFKGQALTDTKSSWAKYVAYLPQKLQLPEGMTVKEYVLLGRTPYRSWFSRESQQDIEQAEQAMEELSVTHFSDTFVSELSGGEAQRVALARVVCQNAPLLILDEPTAALDIGYQKQTLDCIQCLQTGKGITVFSAMHDLTMAGTYADQLVLMKEGAVIESGEPALVLEPTLLSETYEVSVTVVEEQERLLVVV